MVSLIAVRRARPSNPVLTLVWFKRSELIAAAGGKDSESFSSCSN